jgi:hypothetical protein
VRYWLLALSGLLIAGASIVAMDWALYHLVRTGTCASGGPYVIAQPCPEGTETKFFVLFASFFTAPIGVGLWAARGFRGRRSPIGLGMIMWALIFCTLAAVTALAAFGPAAGSENDGAKLAAIILAVVFIPMGLGPLPFAYLANRALPGDLGSGGGGGRRLADRIARGEVPMPTIRKPPNGGA